VAFHHYAVGGAVLLRFATRELAALRAYYNTYFDAKLSIGSVLPSPDRRDLFKVKDPFVNTKTECPK